MSISLYSDYLLEFKFQAYIKSSMFHLDKTEPNMVSGSQKQIIFNIKINNFCKICEIIDILYYNFIFL